MTIRSITSWIWFLDMPPGGAALDASDDSTADIAACLAEHFRDVHVLRPDRSAADAFRSAPHCASWSPASLTAGTLESATWDAGSFSCIALHDSLDRRHIEPAARDAEFARYHRLLRANGWLALAAAQSPALSRGGAKNGGTNRKQLTRALKKAGFREVRCFFVEPTLERPLTILPDSLPAVRAYEFYDAMRGSTGLKRRGVASLGLRSLLYPGYFLLARA